MDALGLQNPVRLLTFQKETNAQEMADLQLRAFTHSVRKYFLSSYYVLRTGMSKQDKWKHCFHGVFYFAGGQGGNRKQAEKNKQE